MPTFDTKKGHTSWRRARSGGSLLIRFKTPIGNIYQQKHNTDRNKKTDSNKKQKRHRRKAPALSTPVAASAVADYNIRYDINYNVYL